MASTKKQTKKYDNGQFKKQNEELKAYFKAYIDKHNAYPTITDVDDEAKISSSFKSALTDQFTVARPILKLEKEVGRKQAIKVLAYEIMQDSVGNMSVSQAQALAEKRYWTLNSNQKQQLFRYALADDAEKRKAKRESRFETRQDRRAGRTGAFADIIKSGIGAIGGFSQGIQPALQTAASALPLMLNHIDPYSTQAVDTRYVANVLAPETASVRQPTTNNQDPLAVAKSRFTLNLTTNASGAVAFTLFANNPLGSGVVNSIAEQYQAYYRLQNDPDFDPQTGLQAVPGTWGAGPLFPTLASVLAFKCTALQCSFLPTVSDLNNQGEIHCCYMPKPITSSTEFGLSYWNMSLPQMEQARPFYFRHNMKGGEINLRKVPNAFDEMLLNIDQLASLNGFNDVMYFVFSGCQPNQVIGEIQIDYQYEFSPAAEAMPILDVQVAGPGAQTISAVTNIFREHPILDMIKRSDGLRMAENVRQLGILDHDTVLQRVRELVKGLNLSL